MIINHIVQRREERRQRKARWMLSRCFTEQVVIIEEPIIISDIIIEEPVIMEEPVMIVAEPIVIEKAIIPVKAIDEAQVQSTSSMSELLILHQTIKTLVLKKRNLTLCI